MNRDRSTIYVVDDEPAVRRAIGRLLTAEGFDVRSCGSAEELLALPMPASAGCVVLDLSMPGMDGMTLHGVLAERGGGLPVVFLTGRGDIPTSVRAMKRGAVDFLTKPVDAAALLDAVRRAMDRARDEHRTRRDCVELARRLADLTPRERQVMDLVVTGMHNKQIAAQLGTVEKTIKVHRARVMEKMGAGSLAELVRMTHRMDEPTRLAPTTR